MAFVFKNLTTETRELMQEEVHYDLERKCLYYSDRLSEHGKELPAHSNFIGLRFFIAFSNSCLISIMHSSLCCN